MRTRVRYLAPFAIATAIGTLCGAPIAVAAPNCVNTSPNTTVCETGGSTQIVTSPPPMNYGGFGYGYGYGYGLGIGGLFIGI